MANMTATTLNHIQTCPSALPASLEGVVDVEVGTLVVEDDPGNAGVVTVSEFCELTEDPANDDNTETPVLLPVDEADTLEGAWMNCQPRISYAPT